jgi:hypothetical protein
MRLMSPLLRKEGLGVVDYKERRNLMLLREKSTTPCPSFL